MPIKKAHFLSTDSWLFYIIAFFIVAALIYGGLLLSNSWFIPGLLVAGLGLLAFICWIVGVFLLIYKKYTIASVMIAIVTAPVLVMVIFGFILFFVRH